MITDMESLCTHVSNCAARCAEKLRAQQTVASMVGVFINTNRFREDLGQYWNFNEVRLLTPSNATVTIVQAAKEALKHIYRQGYHYKKAGVVVMDIRNESPIQHDLFGITPEQYLKLHRIDEAIDRINRIHGTETVVLGAQQYTRERGNGKADVFANAIKHDFRSPNPTTRWSDLMKLNRGATNKR